MIDFRLANTYRQSLVGILIGVAIGAFAGVLLTSPFWGGLGLLAVAIFSLALTLSFSNWRHSNVFVLLLIFSALTTVWVLFLDSHQVSDFGVYLRCGTEYASPWTSLEQWASKCESAWLPGFASYWRRSVLYSLPIGWLVDGAYFGFKLVNAALHIGAIALLYRGVSASFGRAAGVFSASLLAVYPEFWFATTVVSSDNLVILALVGFILALAKLSENQSSTRTVLLVVLLLVVLDLLRSIGPILVVAILLVLPLASEKGSRLKLAKAGILSAIAVVTVGFAPSLLGMTTMQTHGFLATLVGSGLTHSRSFEEAYSWHQYVLPLIDADNRSKVFVGLLAQDLNNAFSFPSFWVQKISTLFGGEGYYFFATSQPLGSPDDFVLTNSAPAIVFNANWAAMMRGVVAFCCIAGGVGALRISQHPLGRAAVTVGSAFLLFIILFGEVQARYSLLIAPALCVAAAGVFAKRDASASALFRDGAKSLFIAFAGLIVCIVLVKAWASAYVAQAPSLVWAIKPDVLLGCESPQALNIEPHRITLPLQGKACYALNATPKNLNGDVVFYVVREPVPPRWSHELHQPVDLTFVAHIKGGALITLHKQLTSEAVAVPILIPSEGGAVASLDVFIRASGGLNGKVSFAYFYDNKRVISNVVEK